MGSLPESLLRHGDVVDIGGSAMHAAVGHRLMRALAAVHTPHVKPTLPDELLYDDVGLPIWNDIIFTPEFYQTHDEIALFDDHRGDILAHLEPEVTLVDLVDRHPAPASVVRCTGLWGTFRDAKAYVQRIRGPRLFLSLGSVLCNDPWLEALNHLRYWAEAMRDEDLLLIGMDAHMLPRDKDKIWAAYHSRDDLYRRFFLNGFDHANKLVGKKWFRDEDWDLEAQLEEKPTTRHRFFLRTKRDIELAKIGRVIAAGEELDWFDSHKYDEPSVHLMCSKAGLRVVNVWQAPDSEFRQYLLKIKTSSLDEDADSAVSGV